jgi:uncharacterized membrane protein
MKMSNLLNPALTLAVVASAATSAGANTYAPAQMVETRSPSQSSSNASAMGLSATFYGSAAIVVGAGVVIGGASKFVVESVKTVGESTVLVVRTVGEAGSEVVQLSLKVGEKSLLAVGVVAGSTINLVATAVGWAIRSSGHTIGFALNEHGRELMRQEKIAG